MLTKPPVRFKTSRIATKAGGERVAIKILQEKSAQALARFDREIKVMRALPPSRFVVSYRGHGKTHSGRPFVAMQLVTGHTLNCVIRSGRRLTEKGAAQLMRVLETEDMLEGDHFEKNLDQGMLAGTPQYLAPEQITDARLCDWTEARTDTPSDVFGLGVIFYQLMTGRTPWPLDPIPFDAPDHDERLHAYLEMRLNFHAARLMRPPGLRHCCGQIAAVLHWWAWRAGRACTPLIPQARATSPSWTRPFARLRMAAR